MTTAEISALTVSLRVSLVATAVIAIPGVGLAWALARRRVPCGPLVSALLQLPLVIPPVVTGYVLLLLLGRNGPIGALLNRVGIELAYTWWAAALASATVAFPLLVRPARAAFEQVDRRLESAASTLGASPLRVFARVTLPLAAPGLLAGLVLAFARAFGEFGATIVFAGNMLGTTRTLPLAVWSASQVPGRETEALRLVLISVVVAIGAMLAAELLVRRLRAGGES